MIGRNQIQLCQAQARIALETYLKEHMFQGDSFHVEKVSMGVESGEEGCMTIVLDEVDDDQTHGS